MKLRHIIQKWIQPYRVRTTRLLAGAVLAGGMFAGSYGYAASDIFFEPTGANTDILTANGHWMNDWGPAFANGGTLAFITTNPPPVEIDFFPNTTAQITLLLPGGETVAVSLAGPTEVHVLIAPNGAAADYDADGLDQVQTEMVMMSLSGNSSLGPVSVTLDPGQPTYGEIEETANNTPGTLDVPPFTPIGTAFSFFDVFVEIEVGGQTLRPATPRYMGSVIRNKPPAPGDVYVNPFWQPVPLLDANGNPTGINVVQEVHSPNPPATGATAGSVFIQGNWQTPVGGWDCKMSCWRGGWYDAPGDNFDGAQYEYLIMDIKYDTNSTMPAASANWGIGLEQGWSSTQLINYSFVQDGSWQHLIIPIAANTPNIGSTCGVGFYTWKPEGTTGTMGFFVANVRLIARNTLTKPDLAPVSIGPAVALGAQVQISYTITNQGNAAVAGDRYDRVYLSTNALLDAGDIQLVNNYESPPLAAGASVTRTNFVNFPPYGAGALYLIVVADTNTTYFIYESDEANNVAAYPLTLTTPDLAPVSVGAPSAVIAGRSVSVVCVVTNQGAGAASGYWYDSIYLSTNTNWESTDTVLANVAGTRNVAAGGSYSWTNTVTIPQVPDGTYYLIVRVDDPNQYGNVLYELNETNNTSAAFALAAVTPDLAPVSVGAPSAVIAGRSVSVVCVVTNQGAGAASGYWYDSIYLSTNTNWESTDTVLANVAGTRNVAAGGSYSWTNTVTIPQVPDGTYYLIVRVDDPNQYGNVLYELNETNNTSAAFALAAVTPDLAPVSVGAPSAVIAGRSVSVVCVVTNQGAGAASGYWYDSIYLSTNTNWESTDTVLANVAGTRNVAAGGSYSWTNTVTIPQVPDGTYYLIVRVDDPNQYGNVLYELNETNNTSAAFALAAVTPDLAPVSVGAPSAVIAGRSVSVVCVVTNQGAGAASGYWYDSIYLSTNTNWESTDTVLANVAGTRNVAAGGSYSWTNTVTIPQVPDGTYYLIVRVDDPNQYGNVLYELNETNNTSAAFALAAVTPDLAPVSVGAPSAVIAGRSVSVVCVVTNQGAGAASGYWYDSIYLSTNTNWESTDTVLANVAGTRNVAAGGSYSWTNTVTIPQVPDGTYYLIVRVDDPNQYGNVLYELNETNNTSAAFALAAVTPDLAPVSVGAPSAVIAGRSVSVVCVVTNQGAGAASGYWYDSIYLSTNTNWESTDTVLANVAGTRNVAAGGSYSWTNTVTIPQVPDGTYYLIVRVDDPNQYGNVLYELNETNNTGAVPIILTQPDLAPVSLSGPGASESGRSMLVGYAVMNQGNGPAVGGWFDRLYLSTNAVWDVQDYQLSAFFQSQSVTNGNGYSRTNMVSLPQWDSGNYFLVLRVDADDGVYELVETNNALAVPLTLTQPDLLPFSISAPSAVSSGQPVAVGCVVTNQGSGTASGSWADGIYLSTDPAWDANDARLTWVYATRSVVTGDSYTWTNAVTIPPRPDGTYYLIVKVDDPGIFGNVLFESNEANNTSPALALTLQSADLVLESVAVPSSGQFGQSLNVTWAVRNIGTEPTTTTNWADRVYLSADTALGNDTILLTHNVSLPAALAPGETYTRNEMVTLPITSSLNPGNYFVLVTTDVGNVQFESNETNNTTPSSTIAVTLPPLPDLVPEFIIAPSNAFASQSISLNWRVRNLGAAAATNDWVDRVYASTDDQVGSDTLLGIFAHTNSLAAGTFYDRTETVTLPATPGQYWIVVTTDAHSQVEEHSGESNNSLVATQAIQVATYSVSVETDVNVAPSGTPIPIRVATTNAATGQLVGNVPVTVRVLHAGTQRVIPLVTDTNGQALTIFQPLAFEAGQYGLAAARPSVNTNVIQDQFVLVGMRAVPDRVGHTLVVGNTVTNQVELRNLGDLPLSGITAVVQSAPANLTIQVATPSSLGALATNLLTYTLRASDDSSLVSHPTIQLTSAEGATAVATLDVQVLRLVPQLVANPGTLNAAMLRGGQALVQCEIANLGGAPSGDLDVLLPVTPWLSLVSTQRIASLGPGERSTVILALTPAADLPLGPYTGTIVLAGQSASLTIPFRFTAVSDLKGSLRVTVVDEFTYYADGSPNVTDATLVLTDPTTGSNIVSGVTGPSGKILLTNVTEAYYNIEVRADGHGEYRSTVFVPADQTNNLTAFLPRQLVTYNWTVIPTEIPDHYIFTLETVFETHVPAPVVTVSPALVNLDSLVETTNQIIFAITNHGLIAVQGVKLQFDANSLFEITPLTDEIPELPGQSAVLVPVMFRRLDGASLASSAAVDANSRPNILAAQSGGSTIGCLFVGGAALYHFLCGGEDRFYNVPIVLRHAIDELCAGGVAGRPNPSSSSGGGGGPYVAAFNYTAQPFTLDYGKIFYALGKCGISAIPGGESFKCGFYLVVGTSEFLNGCVHDRQSWPSCGKTAWKGSWSVVINCGKATGTIVMDGASVGLYRVYKVLACLDSVADALNSGTPATTPPPNVVFLQEQAQRLRATADALAYSFGDPIWLSGEPNDEDRFLVFIQATDTATEEASEEGPRISASERAQLLALRSPAN